MSARTFEFVSNVTANWLTTVVGFWMPVWSNTVASVPEPVECGAIQWRLCQNPLSRERHGTNVMGSLQRRFADGDQLHDHTEPEIGTRHVRYGHGVLPKSTHAGRSGADS